jgi:hypothetical protein
MKRKLMMMNDDDGSGFSVEASERDLLSHLV